MRRNPVMSIVVTFFCISLIYLGYQVLYVEFSLIKFIAAAMIAFGILLIFAGRVINVLKHIKQRNFK